MCKLVLMCLIVVKLTHYLPTGKSNTNFPSHIYLKLFQEF